MSGRAAALGWTGISAGALTLGVVLGLLGNTLRPVREIRRYAEDILEAGVGIGRNLDGVDELRRTHALATAVPDLAGAYLARLGGRQP